MEFPRDEIKHRHTRRLKDWDYCQRAIYMITITLADRKHEWLGRLTLANNGEAQNCATRGAALNDGAEFFQMPSGTQKNAAENTVQDCALNAKIEPTAYGLAALEALAQMPQLYPQVEILEVQLMPEHMHFVIFVKEPLGKPLGVLIRGFKSGCTIRWRHIGSNNGKNSAGLLDGALSGSKGSVVAQSCATEIPSWTEGFNDMILFQDGQLRAMIDYVLDNPRRLAEKRANPALFSRVTELKIPLDNGRIIGKFEALGNRYLLNFPMVQVQCSRRYFAYRRIAKADGGLKIAKDASGEPIIERSSKEYQDRLEATLAAAEHGAVVLSPCISDGERQIAREVFKRKIPLVILKNRGFAKYEKPKGHFFEACAEGRLLMLAPAAWPYTARTKAMTRLEATALNRIAQWLAKEDAADINYHGMQPGNIDKLAEAAVG